MYAAAAIDQPVQHDSTCYINKSRAISALLLRNRNVVDGTYVRYVCDVRMVCPSPRSRRRRIASRRRVGATQFCFGHYQSASLRLHDMYLGGPR